MVNYTCWLPLIDVKVDCAHFIHVHTAIKASVIALQHAIWVVIFIFFLVFYLFFHGHQKMLTVADSMGHTHSGNDENPDC